MPITIKKEYHPSIFPYLALAKIEDVWRVVNGDYICYGDICKDVFITLYGGQYLHFTYPDFRMDRPGTAEDMYESVCNFNVNELKAIQTKASLAKAQAVVNERRNQARAAALLAEQDDLYERLRQEMLGPRQNQRDEDLRAAYRRDLQYLNTIQ